MQLCQILQRIINLADGFNVEQTAACIRQQLYNCFELYNSIIQLNYIIP